MNSPTAFASPSKASSTSPKKPPPFALSGNNFWQSLYILQSLSHRGEIYTGMTNDLKQWKRGALAGRTGLFLRLARQFKRVKMTE
jgi:hypothetical protein